MALVENDSPGRDMTLVDTTAVAQHRALMYSSHGEWLRLVQLIYS
jgi:hypothetical protein